MKAIDFLATSLNKRNEKANQELGLEIIKGTITRLILHLRLNSNN
jgi:hypothetical protein